MPDGVRHLPNIAGPTSAREPFTFSAATRIAFSDTDAQGVVYYGRYAHYFDLARVEYWRNLHVAAHDDPAHGEFVMRASNIEYHAPARFDDIVEVFVRVSRIGTTSITFEFAVVLADGSDRLLATSTQTMVNIDLQTRTPIPVSPSIRERVSQFEGRVGQ